jgi:hypothetical protein
MVKTWSDAKYDYFELERTVEVFEPGWLSYTTDEIYKHYLMPHQYLERYDDLYWELNYHTDIARLGLEHSLYTCDRYLKSWQVPTGHLINNTLDAEGYHSIIGYTFKLHQRVELEFQGTDPIENLFVYDVREEIDWLPNGRLLEYTSECSNPSIYTQGARGYLEGDFVQYLDNIYYCKKTHEINIDKRFKDKIIFPDKALDEDGLPYWELACRVQFARYLYSGGKRNVDLTVSSSLNNLSGNWIRAIRPIVDSQGFLYELDYSNIIEPEETGGIIIDEVGNAVIEYKEEGNAQTEYEESASRG